METIFLFKISIAGYLASLCASGLIGFALCAALVALLRASHYTVEDLEEEYTALHADDQARDYSDSCIDEDIQNAERIRNQFREWEHE